MHQVVGTIISRAPVRITITGYRKARHIQANQEVGNLHSNIASLHNKVATIKAIAMVVPIRNQEVRRRRLTILAVTVVDTTAVIAVETAAEAMEEIAAVAEAIQAAAAVGAIQVGAVEDIVKR